MLQTLDSSELSHYEEVHETFGDQLGSQGKVAKNSNACK
jgi:hypothetical protein